ncbi:MAG: hypothetical protein HY747_02260 [Elusimicrobia bacterium]|nr:hypothetical protein [Elusimicrobiota bacterium]
MNSLNKFYWLLLLSPYIIMAQPLPQPLRYVIIESAVNLDKATNVFTYIYIVANPSSNANHISHFDIDIKKQSGGIDFSDEGLVTDTRSGRRMYEDIKKEFPGQFVPTAAFRLNIPPLPRSQDWLPGFGVKLIVGWGSREGREMQPGQSVSGFKLQSRGLPGVRNFDARPYVDLNQLPEEIATDGDRVFQLEQSLVFHGKTVGPSAPKGLDPASLLDYLIDQKHQAKEVGWISGSGVEGIEKSLDAKLEATKDAVSRGQTNAARNQLSAFINELNALWGKKLNDNAYFLLKVNAEFIISKLRP